MVVVAAVMLVRLVLAASYINLAQLSSDPLEKEKKHTSIEGSFKSQSRILAEMAAFSMTPTRTRCSPTLEKLQKM